MKALSADRYLGPAHYMAWINAGDGRSSTPCLAEDVTMLGATLRDFDGALPGEFTLHFSRRGDAKVRCRVISRAETSCNVEFVASLAIYN